MKKILVILVIFGLIFTSCHKNDNIEPDNGNSMDEIMVSDNFDWKTTVDYNVDIDVQEDGILYIQNSESENYLKYHLFQNQNDEIILTLPTYEDTVYLIFRGNRISYELNSSKIKYQFI